MIAYNWPEAAYARMVVRSNSREWRKLYLHTFVWAEGKSEQSREHACDAKATAKSKNPRPVHELNLKGQRKIIVGLVCKPQQESRSLSHKVRVNNQRKKLHRHFNATAFISLWARDERGIYTCRVGVPQERGRCELFVPQKCQVW